MTPLTLDKSGRILLPKPLRDELNLAPGDTLEVETSGERITLHPVRSASPLQKERGVWVFAAERSRPSRSSNKRFVKFARAAIALV